MNPALHPWLQSALKAHVTQKEAELQRTAAEYLTGERYLIKHRDRLTQEQFTRGMVKLHHCVANWATVVNDIKKIDPSYPISTEIHKVLKP